jgi:uncharacterized damage-inducible protein DinB
MVPEVEDLTEHLQRFRAVTLQVLDIVSDEDLSWRPDPDSFSCGQQLLHIAQAEDFYTRGLFENDWDLERLRLRKDVTSREELRALFFAVRERTLARLQSLDDSSLGRIWHVPNAPVPMTLRSWLWFVLEHEVHHKAQLAVYLRQMGHVAPFYALPLPLGQRPDIKARQDLGGF